MTAVPASPKSSNNAPFSRCRQGASNDNRASDIKLGQYYTRLDVAIYCYATFCRYFNPVLLRMVEPSAGTGSFFRLLPVGSLGFDLEPKYPGVRTADFLTIDIPDDQPIGVIGNPPFGKNASMAIRFFNRAASHSRVIALIVPRTFRKASVQNRLDRSFHCIHDEAVPEDSFEFRGKPYNVPATFQIWVRRDEVRPMRTIETRHPDFAFTKPEHADFAIQRVGARAGRIHHDLTASERSHYFIKGPVEAIMAQLDFTTVVGNVAGNPSLAKSEIVALYRARIAYRQRIASAKRLTII